MNRDDIIRMAREAGFTASNGFSQLIVRHSNGSWVDIAESLERFADLVAAAERKACAEAAVDAVAFNGGTVQMEAHVRQAVQARN